MLVLHENEPESFVPPLEFGLLRDDRDADCPGFFSGCKLKHMSDKGFADTLFALIRTDRKPFQIEDVLIGLFKSHTPNSFSINFGHIIEHTFAELGLDFFHSVV